MSVTGTTQTVGNTFSNPTPTPPNDFYAVLYVPQNLSPSQKAQAIANIGALTSADIQGLIASATFNATTRILTLNRVNGTQYTFDLSQNTGVADIDFDANNDLEVTFLDGSKKVITITNLFNGLVKTVNGIPGPNVVIGIDDISNLRLELNSRVPTGTTITIDGDVQSLQSNPVFTSNAVKFTPQTLSAPQQQIARDNLDIYSKTEVNNLIGTPSSHSHDELGSLPHSSYNANQNLAGTENRVFKFRSHIDAASATNLFPIIPTNIEANAVVDIATSNNTDWHQLGFSNNGNIYHRVNSTATKGTWRLIINESRLPIVNNPTITLQANGSIAGGGSFALNQTGAQTISFDLTAQTKADIQAGQNAGQLVASINTWFKRFDMSGGGSVNPIGTMITVVHTANTTTTGVTILDHDFDGAKLVIRAFPNAQVTCAINFITDDGTAYTSTVLEATTEYYWDGGLGTWTLGNS